MTPVTITTLMDLARQSGEKPVAAAVLVQVQATQNRTTKNQKPYLELTLADGGGQFPLKIWSDAPVYEPAGRLETGAVVCFDGTWTLGSFGIEGRDLRLLVADEAAKDGFFAGDPVLRARQDADFADIQALCGSITDPRFHALCQRFFTTHGERFRRTAAARRNHHARRGGLVEHVGQMMRAASALCAAYPELNRDLLLTGVLFHDCGKLWENPYPERGFNQSQTLHGEMLGHIPLGIELANKLFRETESAAGDAWIGHAPPTEECRLHLLHLIGSHHGEYEFGSPVLPRTPEAFALHYIDNLDAKLEMVRGAYAQAKQLAPGIYERQFPLPSNLVHPLPVHTPAAAESPSHHP